MKTVKEIKQELGSLQDKMLGIQKVADDADRRMSPEETDLWNRMDADYNAGREDLLRRESTERRTAELEGRVTTPPNERRGNGGVSGDDIVLSTEEHKALVASAFNSWMRGGFDSLSQEHRQVMSQRRRTVDGTNIQGAQSVGTGSGGGYLVPTGFSDLLEQFLKAYGGMRTHARILATPTGNTINWPTVDDTANVGEIINENSAYNAQDIAFGQVNLGAFKYSSKIVLVSVELLQDSFFPIESLVAEMLAVRIGRITNTHFTTGASPGTATPFGVVAQAGAGKVGVAGQTTSIITDDIFDLKHAVDPAYRQGAMFMMADSSLKVLKKLKDSTGRPLWQPALSGLANPVPDTIDGDPYFINQDVVAMAANAKSVVYGNFSKYCIRDAKDVTILRLVERYAELGQVAFLAFSRHDGRCLNTNAFKYYQNSAT